jgi:hypothetical protein
MIFSPERRVTMSIEDSSLESFVTTGGGAAPAAPRTAA